MSAIHAFLRSRAGSYAVAVAAVAVAAWMRLLLDSELGDGVPFITLFFAVVVAAWFGGLGPALAAVVLSALAAAHWFIPPDDSLLPSQTADWARLALFLAMGALIALIGQRMRLGRLRAEEIAEDRLRQQERLGESEALKTSIVDTALDCVVVIDHHGNIVEFNASAEQTFGYSRYQVLGRPMAEFLIPPEHRQRHYEGLARYLATGEAAVLGKRLEFPALRADGVEFPAELAITQTPAPGPPLFTAWVRDLTKQKRMEQRRGVRLAVAQLLNESLPVEAMVSGILRSVCEALEWQYGALWTVDQQSQVLRCRDLWRRPDKPLQPFEAVSRGRVFEPGIGLPGRVWASGKPAWISDVVRDLNFPRAPVAKQCGLHSAIACPVHVDGKIFGVFEFFSGQIQEPDEELVETIGLIGDQIGQFLERRRAEEALRRSETELSDFFENASVGLHWVNAEGIVVRVNQAELDMLGYEREEYLGRPIADYHEDRDTIDTILRRLKDGESLRNCEARMRCKNGSIKHVLIDASIYRENAEFVQTRCFTRDITERVEMERALKDSDRRKDEFLAMLGHELRNPLAPIRSGLDVLALEAPANETIALMQEQIEHLVRLVDDLLDISRIVRGKIELRKEIVDLRVVIRRAVAAVRSLVEDQDQELVVSAPEASVWLDADPVRLVQVIENLLNNASKYSDPESRIELTARREHAEAIISVRDNGIGIEPHVLPQVFDWYVQASRSYHRAQGGLGLGLTLVQTLVELHGGTVSACSAGPGRGSEFVVRLPVSPVEPEKIERQEETCSNASSARADRRILIVDDNEAAAATLALLLARMGSHQVEVAHNGAAALAAAQAFQPDLVLLDIAMPGMSGHDVARALRQTPAGESALLVALTGYGQEEDRLRSLEAGFDEHLVKPPSREGLLAVLDHWRLNGRSQVPGPDPPSLPTSTNGISRVMIPSLEKRAGEYLRDLAHEVGNALHPMHLIVQILSQPDLTPEIVERLRKGLESQLPSLEKMLQDLRRVSLIARDAIEPRPQAIDAATLLRNATEQFRRRSGCGDGSLDVQIADELPRLEADPDLLEKSVLELLSNAARHSPSGGPIRLTAESKADEVVIRVSDHGSGIAPELLPYVFDLFVRSETGAFTAADRFGVGLTFVRQVVQKHGGEVGAESAGRGQGATFTIRLPTNPRT